MAFQQLKIVVNDPCLFAEVVPVLYIPAQR
jgi:hypothetical protein